jgi:hypothetical protein
MELRAHLVEIENYFHSTVKKSIKERFREEENPMKFFPITTYTDLPTVVFIYFKLHQKMSRHFIECNSLLQNLSEKFVEVVGSCLFFKERLECSQFDLKLTSILKSFAEYRVFTVLN